MKEELQGNSMRTVRYLIVNGIFAALLYLGFFVGVEGARNVAQFWTWFMCVTSFAMFSDDVAKAAAAKWMPVPVWFDILVDIAACGVFVWFAWWWTAGAYALHSVLLHGRRENGKEMLAKEAAGAAAK